MRRLCALLLLAAACAAGVDWTTYKPQGYVSDFAGVIDAENRQRLEEFSKHFEKATGVEMAFVALPSLPGKNLRLYMDACCLNRLTDDQGQARIRHEAEAVEGILRLVRERRATWVSSAVLEIEISRNPDQERRHDAAALLACANEGVTPSDSEAARAELLQGLGFSPFDALHLACAERAGADVFLTTDDDLLRRARRSGNLLRIRVENPVSWYQEVAP